MLKITFLGAGSTIFARNVLGDSMCSEALRDCEIALYDIDAQRLKESEKILSAINKGKGNHAKIKGFVGLENLEKALEGANF
ncbi:MAG: alpha-glucosidase/alpha-galactosidase, partial [Treponema sp.]|nr:alpha-glucosidase/alpha-galactosidase [Treponema sp.]